MQCGCDRQHTLRPKHRFDQEALDPYREFKLWRKGQRRRSKQRYNRRLRRTVGLAAA